MELLFMVLIHKTLNKYKLLSISYEIRDNCVIHVYEIIFLYWKLFKFRSMLSKTKISIKLFLTYDYYSIHLIKLSSFLRIFFFNPVFQWSKSKIENIVYLFQQSWTILLKTYSIFNVFYIISYIENSRYLYSKINDTEYLNNKHLLVQLWVQ